MSKILFSVIGALFMLLTGIATWWITGVNDHMKTVDQLQYRSIYLDGNIPQAPVKYPAMPPNTKR